jgi:hypothetical protein
VVVLFAGVSDEPAGHPVVECSVSGGSTIWAVPSWIVCPARDGASECGAEIRDGTSPLVVVEGTEVTAEFYSSNPFAVEPTGEGDEVLVVAYGYWAPIAQPSTDVTLEATHDFVIFEGRFLISEAAG